MNLWRGTVCTNCEKEHECAEAERLFKSGAIAYGCSACVPKPQTNADRIRAMTDEELADIMYPYECVGCPVETKNGECLREGENCETALLRWLKSPVEVDNGT